MKYSVIIAERNEPDLANTVKNIEANSSAKVIVMSDSQGLGPQAMRDRGIGLAAGSDVVIIMDGHMRVKAGTLDAMAAWCMANPKSVAVPRCLHSYTENWDQQPYSGASFAWMDWGDDAKKMPTAMAGKWRTEHTIGQIPCVMGACYAMTRDWYMEGLRRPWRLGTGWGSDEEILSASTWLRGGTVDLLPLSVWHQARKPGQVPYVITDEQYMGVTANKVRVVNSLPMTKDERAELLAHLLPHRDKVVNGRQLDFIHKILATTARDVTEYRNFLQAGPMSWAYFKNNIVGVQTVAKVKPAGMKELRAEAKKKGLTVPFGCSATDLAKMLQGDIAPIPLKATKKKSAPKANWGPNEYNMMGQRCCVECHSLRSKVNRTIPGVGMLVRRYRECLDCNKAYPTKEITILK